jgi:hypothetical protein
MLDELAPGLHRWTARHPAWTAGAEPESPDDWPPDVGSVAYAGPGGLVLIDPLVADWDELDALVDGRSVTVLTTLRWHRRSRDEVVRRYGATLLDRRQAPPGVRRIPIERAAESMVWIEEHATLVPGDRLLGDGRGGLRMCPESWLRYLPDAPTLADLRAALRPLLELPVERVLVSHGEPVLRDGREAIRAALD